MIVVRTGAAAALAVALCVVALNSGAPAAESGPAPGWVAERVSAPRLFELDSRALAIDSEGVPHVAYGGDRLYLASRIDETWLTRVIDDTPGVGRSASLALDALDRVHIAYLDAASDRILYTTDASGSWKTEVVAGVAEAAHVALQLDEAGGVHVVFLDGGMGTLSYATDAGGEWAVATVDGSGDVVGEGSIHVDGLGNVHVAYETLTGTVQTLLRLRYATNESGAWNSETVVESSPFGAVPGGHDIGVDGSGDVHIVYDDEAADLGSDRELRHATNAGEGWASTLLDGLGSAGVGASMRLGEGGDLNVAYLSSGSVAYLTTAGTVRIRLVGTGGGSTSLALDADGRAHLVHGGASGREVRYLRPGEGGWTEEAVDAGATAGRWPALVLDSEGSAHVLHRADREIVYQTDAGGNWTREVLFETSDDADDSQIVDLVGDAAGTLHATWTRNDLSSNRIYATRTRGGAWTTETVPGFGAGSGFARIALDAVGRVHLLYPRAVGSSTIATREDGVWTPLAIDHRPQYPVRDFDVDAAGVPHILGHDTTANLILHTTRSGGVWVDEVVAAAGPAGAASLDVDGMDHVHILFTAPDGLRYATNRSGEWVTERVAGDESGEASDLLVDPTGAVHATFRDPATGSVEYARRTADGWTTFTVDGGAAAGALALGAERFTTAEGRDLWIPVVRRGRTSLARTTTSLAIDAAGGLHVAYDDATLGDLKYASPGSARGVSATLTVVDGTATPGADFSLERGTLGWAPQDSGVKYAHLAVSEDAELEAEETVDVELGGLQGAAVIGAPSRAVVRILDAAAAPADVPDAAARSFLFLTSVTALGGFESPRVVVTGFLDTGPEDLALGETATITAGLSTLTLQGAHARRGVARYSSDGARLTLSPSRRGSSRSRLKLILTGDVAAIGVLSGELTIRVRTGIVDASGSVAVELGAYRRTRPTRGTLLGPDLQLTRCRARVPGGGRDALSLTAVLPNLGAAPEEPHDVTVRFGNRFSATIPGEDLKGRKQVRAYRGRRGGVTSLVIDYRRGILRLRAADVDLGPFVPGSLPVLITIDTGEARSLLVRLAHVRRTLVY